MLVNCSQSRAMAVIAHNNLHLTGAGKLPVMISEKMLHIYDFNMGFSISASHMAVAIFGSQEQISPDRCRPLRS